MEAASSVDILGGGAYIDELRCGLHAEAGASDSRAGF
jgi:hypothetical protein